MAQAAIKHRMTPEEFNVWEQTQPDRHELVDGVPQLKFVEWDGPQMMVGAREGHNDIVTNLLALLVKQLRDKNCRPYAADGKVRIPSGNYRYPDIAINCAPRNREATALTNPVAVIEVLSKSTFWIDNTTKLRDYQSVPSIRYILLLAQDEVRGQIWQRGPEGWEMENLDGAETMVRFPAADDVGFALGEAYEGLI